jgi:hypothetical protein
MWNWHNEKLRHRDTAGNFLTEPKYVKKQKGKGHLQIIVGNYISKQSMIPKKDTDSYKGGHKRLMLSTLNEEHNLCYRLCNCNFCKVGRFFPPEDGHNTETCSGY